MIDIKNLSVKFFSGNECLDAYLREIRKFKALTAEEEQQLFKAFKENNNKAAREKIINSNQLFVFSLAKRYAKTVEEVLDYVNEGNIGLITALDLFDYTQGYKFITFAVWYIQRSMNYYFTVTNCLIKKSNSMKIGKKVERIREKTFAETGQVPTNEEIIAILKENYNITIGDESDIASMEIESINETVSEDYEVEDCADFNEATSSKNLFEETINQEELSLAMNYIFKDVPEKLAIMTKMFYGIGYERRYTINEISDKMEMEIPDVIVRIKMTVKYFRHQYGSKLAI